MQTQAPLATAFRETNDCEQPTVLFLIKGSQATKNTTMDRRKLIWKPRQISCLLLASLFLLLLLGGVEARTCVSVPSLSGGEEHECTDDPLLLTRAINPKTGEQSSRYNLGLAQRIDGTESEKKAIMDVLVKMDDYFINEVLAHPEYASVRNRW